MQSDLPLFEIEAGEQLYRVIKREFDAQGNRLYDALDPNPYRNLEWISDIRAKYQDGSAVSGRFSPFLDQHGNPVPTLYLAPLRETAYFETILRPRGAKGQITLQKDQISPMEAARVTFSKSLKLADCRACFLKDGNFAFWPYSKDQLYSASQLKCLDNARSLAKHVHDTYPELDGLVWDSVQHDGVVPVYMLFGDSREGEILSSVAALNDISTWKPYLAKCMSTGSLTVSEDLAALL